MTTSRRRLSARIVGRVQGVGFRQFTESRARSLGLTGWVRNEPDGSVALVAEGDEETLRQLLDHVEQGPPTGHVDGVDVRWEDATSEHQGFTTRY